MAASRQKYGNDSQTWEGYWHKAGEEQAGAPPRNRDALPGRLRRW
ncbi:hypothetical protein ACH4S8_04605 [Streptomyces sp. NPDC021080]